MVTKILLADDHKELREAIACLLNKEPDMEVIGQAEEGRGAIQLARELQPNVIIMDIYMPNINGFEATCQIVQELPDIKIIGLSLRSDKLSVDEMLKAGASGYVLKQQAFQELVPAIRTVVSGKTYLSSQINQNSS